MQVADSFSYYTDGFLMKLDNNGNILWHKRYTDPNPYSYGSTFTKVVELSNGDLVTIGSYPYGPNGSCLMRTDASGNLITTQLVPLTGPNSNALIIMDNNSNDEIVIAGSGYNIYNGNNFSAIFKSDNNLNFTC